MTECVFVEVFSSKIKFKTISTFPCVHARIYEKRVSGKQPLCPVGNDIRTSVYSCHSGRIQESKFES